jgi:hypothetical protein
MELSFMFIGRKAELAALNQLYQKTTFEFAVNVD